MESWQLTESVPSPISAKRDIKGNRMLLEIRLRITAFTAPRSLQVVSRPVRRIGVLTLQVARDIWPREVPDPDPIPRPFHHEHCTTGIVEGFAVGRGVRVDEGTAVVGIGRGTTGGVRDGRCEAVREEGAGDGSRLINLAAFAGMDRVLVVRVAVDALDDVNFAVMRPVGADGPKSRPSSGLNG